MTERKRPSYAFQLAMIQAMPAVKSASLRIVDGKRTLRLTLHPCVIEPYRGVRYKLPSNVFLIREEDPGCTRIRMLDVNGKHSSMERKPECFRHPTVDPHSYTDPYSYAGDNNLYFGGCFGGATGSVREAVDRQDWVTVAYTLIAFTTTESDDAWYPYNSEEDLKRYNTEVVDLPVGWVIPNRELSNV